VTLLNASAKGRQPWLVPVMLIVSGSVFFAAIAADVHFQGKLVQWDRVIAPWLYERQNWWLVFCASAVSGMGQLWFAVGATVAACIYLWRRKLFLEMAVCIGGMTGSALINDTLKGFFKVPRPSRHLAFVWQDPVRQGYSFPSGHTMAVMVMTGLAMLLLMRLKPRPLQTRLWMALVVLAMGVLEAAALMVVGVHYLTDVLGAIGASIAWLGVLRWLLPPVTAAVETPAAEKREALQA
jgi:undecaprenyl-diphosphatase